MRLRFLPLVTGLALVALVGCGDTAKHTVEEGMGPNPVLPEPQSSLIPTVNVATAMPWADGETPKAAEGLAVNAFARGLDHPRWLYVLPNGDVLVAETNKPSKEGTGGLRGWVEGLIMGKAGANAATANRITLLRDADGDGIAEVSKPFLEGLNSPFGMALVGDTFYVANADAIVSFPYKDGEMHIDAAPTKVMDLPGGPINHHWTKNIVASKDGSRLYVTVGSNSNVGENGMDVEKGRAAIHELDLASGKSRLFATGLRNPNGLAFEPVTGALWTAVNERDEIGSDLVPDYMTSVKDGGFYGWPYSYFGQHVDVRVYPQNPDLVAKAIKPDYALGPHTASLGLAFYERDALPAKYRGGAFVGQHGSWNRKPASGYKVIFVPFADGQPAGAAEDVLTGFLDADGNARGRPVGVTVDGAGALLVADDVGNTIWRVTSER
jgi:glucose/arabinose dehydrogenase